MANLRVTVVTRLRQDGTRKWIPVESDQGPQPYYVRYCTGSKPHYLHVGDRFADALSAKRNMEALRRQGLLTESEPEPESTHGHDCETCLQSYLAWMRSPGTRKRDSRRYVESSIRSRESEIRAFLRWSHCVTVEEIRRETLTAYRDHLYAQDYETRTVNKKIIFVTSWLRKNQIVRITGLLQDEDLYTAKDTEPNPFHPAEIKAMMSVASMRNDNGRLKLALRVFRATGIREQELCHLEKSDLNVFKSTIKIQPKPKYNWVPKTVASEREIKISKALMQELMALPTAGLLFPNKSGGVESHLYKVMSKIMQEAGVTGHKPDHDWRDTFCTEKIRQKVHDQRDIMKMSGHKDVETFNLYAAYVDQNSEEAELSAEMSDPESEYILTS